MPSVPAGLPRKQNRPAPTTGRPSLQSTRYINSLALIRIRIPDATSPMPVGMLAAASTRYVRRDGHLYPACEVYDKKNEQKSPKNAATNIHLILR
jgi:hypothetical protein